MESEYLEILDGQEAGKIIALDSDEIALGREPRLVDIVVSDDMVSGRHAIVRKSKDGWVIVDVGTDGEGSKNGTFIGSSQEKIPANLPVRIKRGVEIRLGPIRVRFGSKNTIEFDRADPLNRLHIDESAHRVFINSQNPDDPPICIKLRPQAFILFNMLWQAKGEICKPQDILEKLWPGETSVQGRQDDIYTIVKEIRKRFTEVIGKDIIENIPKVGYRLKIGSSGNA